jgi:glutathione S-transferase
MPILYDNSLSRNGYKVRLLAAHLGLALTCVEVDILSGVTRQADFLAKNVAGRIPVLVFEDGTSLAESNAILFYLAQGTPLWPADRREQAELLRWMFFEQNMIEGSVGTARFWRKIGRDRERPDAFAHRLEAAIDGLSALERHLGSRAWLALDRFSIADISVYGYVSVAAEAGLAISDFPAVQAWLRRIETLPNHLAANGLRGAA